MPKSKTAQIPADVVERIKTMRANGVRVVEVAKLLQVSTGTVSLYANGMHKSTY